MNSGHTFLFILTSISIAFLLYPSRTKLSPLWFYCCVFIISVLFGASLELIQSVVGREASWHDLLRDALGALIGLCLFLVYKFRDAGSNQVLTRIALFAAVAVLAIDMAPLTRLSLHYIERTMAFPTVIDPESDWASSFIRRQRGMYPGLAVIEPEPDWSAYNELSFDVDSTSVRKLQLGLRIHDANHDQRSTDRFNIKVTVMPGHNSYKVLIDEIRKAPAERELDMMNIAGLTFYSKDQKEWDALNVRNVELNN